MKKTTPKKMKKKKKAKNSFNSEFIIVCKHCGKEIKETKLIGLSIVCASCKKPQH